MTSRYEECPLDECDWVNLTALGSPQEHLHCFACGADVKRPLPLPGGFADDWVDA